MSAVEARNIEKPHETRPYRAHGHMDVVTLGDFTIGKGTFEPGWRWSEDVKPIAGTESCQVLHTGFVLSGTMAIRMNDVVDGGEGFVAVGTLLFGTQYGKAGAWTSSDGLAWTRAPDSAAMFQGEMLAVTVADGRFVAVGTYAAPDDYVPTVWLSPG